MKIQGGISMRINHNISALNTYRQLSANQAMGGKSLEKLSSGLRINRAGDDAAGLAISEKMRGQIRGLEQASRNAQDGISMIQTAEGALNETHSILQRMRELAVQASNDTNTDSDRLEIQQEINELTQEVTRIGNNTEFNTKKVINGDMSGAGTGAAMEKQTLNFAIAGSPVQAGVAHDPIKLNIGGEEYTIAFDHTAAAGTNVVNTGTNTVTIGSLTVAAIGTNTASALNQLFGLEPTNSLKDFTISSTATTISIEAKSTGSFAGSVGADSIKLVSGMVAEALVQDANGADGTGGQANLQIGSNQSQQFTVAVADMRAQNLKISGTVSGAAHGVIGTASFTSTALTEVSDSGTPEYALDVSSASKATSAITVIDSAITGVSAERSKLGAFQNRLEHTINNLSTSAENLTAAESRVRDVDMAKEMMEFTKNNILSQAAQAMLAQANQQPQGVLQLLR